MSETLGSVTTHRYISSVPLSATENFPLHLPPVGFRKENSIDTTAGKAKHFFRCYFSYTEFFYLNTQKLFPPAFSLVEFGHLLLKQGINKNNLSTD